MNKKLKKANEILAAACEYAASVSKNVSEQSAIRRNAWLGSRAVKRAEVKTVEQLRSGYAGHAMYRKCVVVKIAKGDFRVEADGMVIERRFKSVTAANEWITKHTV